MTPHRGSEHNNIRETWERNEAERAAAAGTGRQGTANRSADRDLEETIKEEAAEYDNASKEDRLLEGDRASVNDTGDDR
ncbi:MAG: hypothetical protein EOO14_12635 [Chitinophagaceae bacterium]|nr:MAG: hypothetical protein EOO14_12635 [Chitinophagaceae bacterium]